MTLRLLLLFVFSALQCSVFAQEFKIIGYLPYYRFDIIDQIDYKKITHLNLAFLNPDIDGNLTIGDRDIDPLIAHAKSINPGIEVFIALAGGGLTEESAQAYDKFMLPENRNEFAGLLVDYVIIHDLDGIDVDLEWGHVNEYYSPFVLILSDSLKSHGKQLSAALPATYRYPEVSQEAMDAFDFVNLMAYDKTGPWRPNDPGPHSPRELAIQSIAYWRNQGLDNVRMTLGVPFYGYDFTDQSNVTAFTFETMVNESEHYAYSDQVGEKYYNGIPTIQYKAHYAMNEVAGIMIWELGQDAFANNNEYSLLSAIDFVVKTGNLPITGLDINLTSDENRIKIFPNPFQETLTISSREVHEMVIVHLFDLQGREHFREEFLLLNNEKSLDFHRLVSGLYVLKVEFGEVCITKKIIKSN